MRHPGIETISTFRWLVAAGLLVITGLWLPIDAQAQDRERRRGGEREWNAAEYLNGLDRDKNGYLNAQEMSGRGARFLDKFGFDRSGNVAISQIMKKIESAQDEKAREQRREEIEAGRKVAKFGADPELPPVQGFGEESGSGQLEGSVEDNFGNEIAQIVDAYVRRFDEDEDGFLAGGETTRVLRMVGTMEETDTDKDGRLSPLEIASGYKQKQQQRQAASNGNSPGAREEEKKKAEMFRRPGNSNSTSSVKISSSAGQSINERANKYVDGVFKKYDTNRDNMLSPEEREKLRVSFNDSNGDGNISRQEAVGFVSGTQKTGGSVSPAATSGAGDQPDISSADDSPQSAGDVRRDLFPTGRTPGPRDQRSSQAADSDKSGASSEFLKLDANGDGQLQLAEFTAGEKFSEALYQSFLETDGNDDGVVTPDEYK